MLNRGRRKCTLLFIFSIGVSCKGCNVLQVLDNHGHSRTMLTDDECRLEAVALMTRKINLDDKTLNIHCDISVNEHLWNATGSFTLTL